MSPRPRILSVIGARPEIIQAAPVSAALADLADEILVHTGQHYDVAMSEAQILATRLPQPHHNLGVGSRPRDEQLAIGQERLAEIIELERPDVVVVRGDTNATLSGARAAVAAGVPLVHVEAGLRSYRDDMPEERNRIETDRLSDLLLRADRAAPAPTSSPRASRAASRSPATRSATRSSARAPTSCPPRASTCSPRCTATTTPTTPTACSSCSTAWRRSPWRVIFPVHPRTRAALATWKLTVPGNVDLVDPVAYTRMLELERGAQVIATDSGGVQREAYLWGVPCLTLREETEWVDTVAAGWNVLVGVDPEAFERRAVAPAPRGAPADLR